MSKLNYFGNGSGCRIKSQTHGAMSFNDKDAVKVKEINKIVKQVIVVRKDLKKMMKQRGKLSAQVGHAVLAPFLKDMRRMRKFNAFDKTYEMILDVDFNSPMDEWLTGSFTKVCLAVFSEEELLELYDKLIENGINAVLIKDNGRTVFNGVETYTCLGIIPMETEDIDKFTGHLPLL